ncbi:hypothetical protein QNM99_00525 [Pseudomonas sp. PCH446]
MSENQQASLVYTLSDYFARRPTLESVAPGLVRTCWKLNCRRPRHGW